MKNRKLPYSHTNTQSLDSSSVGLKLTDYYWSSFKPDTLCPSGLFSSQLLSAARSFLLLLPTPCLHHKRDPEAQSNSASPCVCCLYLLFVFITCRETISIVAQMLLFQLSAISLPVLRPVWVPFHFHSQLHSCTTTIVLPNDLTFARPCFYVSVSDRCTSKCLMSLLVSFHWNVSRTLDRHFSFSKVSKKKGGEGEIKMQIPFFLFSKQKNNKRPDESKVWTQSKNHMYFL